MLAPDGRALLLDALRPPVGYVLDQAVATTFTLDLETALTVPLAFAGYNLRESPDTIELLEAIRSSGDNINIFCQAGAIQASHWPSDLVGLLERAVHEVPRPKPGCIFHPKLWVIRYREREDGTTSYRCLVLSRNLTADRSWDLILRLDSNNSVTKVNPDNDGLNRMLAALPAMAKLRPTHPRAMAVAALAEDIRRVTWELPEDVREIAFYPFGLTGVRRPKTQDMFRGYRHLIVSPFITTGGVSIIVGDESSDLSIISRADELDKLPAASFPGTNIFSISPTIASLGDATEGGDKKVDTDRMLSDLHAKLYVVESNRAAHVYLGSANATENGLNGNIEILCRLSGGASKLGVDSMLGKDAPLRAILESYAFPDEPVTDLKSDLKFLIESYLIDIASLGIDARATESEGGWSLRVTSAKIPTVPDEATAELFLAPFNRPADSRQVSPNARIDVSFGPVAAADLTPFLVLTCRAEIHGQKLELSIVVRARLTGDPEKRLDDIIIRQIDTPEKFLRLLSLLLGLVSGLPIGDDANNSSETGAVWAAGTTSGILETLVRALAENPEALDRLDGIVGRLGETEEGRRVLPGGWSELWSAVTEAKSLLGREH